MGSAGPNHGDDCLCGKDQEKHANIRKMLFQQPCDYVQKETGKKGRQTLAVNDLGNLIIGNQESVIGSSQNGIEQEINKNNQPVSPLIIRRNIK